MRKTRSVRRMAAVCGAALAVSFGMGQRAAMAQAPVDPAITYQGQLRFAPLDVDALCKRVTLDGGDADVRLVFTHRDQLDLPNLGALPYLSSWGPSRSHEELHRAAS